MRILVMGAGGLGGYYGGMLARGGQAVTFVARGANLTAIAERGLQLHTDGQVYETGPLPAVATPAEARGPFDLVLFTVKTYDMETAADALRPAVGAGTAVLPLQNGVEATDRIGAILGPERVLCGLTYLSSAHTSPGVIMQPNATRGITFGEPSGERTARVAAIAAALEGAGIPAIVPPNPRLAVWQKFIMQAPHATLTSSYMTAVGPIRQSPEGLAMYRTLMAETVAVGRAAGVPIPDDAIDDALAVIAGMPPHQKTSMQLDYERERRVELEQITGSVVRMGSAYGVPTPHFDALYAPLKIRALAFGGV